MKVWPATPSVAALVRAVVAKDLEGARSALSQGANVDCVHIGSVSSALAIAVRHRNQEMVELLLGAGANPAFPVPPVKNKVKDPSGFPLLYEFTNALAMACTSKQTNLLALMLEAPTCKLHFEVVQKIAYTWALHPKTPNQIFETLKAGSRRDGVPMPPSAELLQAAMRHRIKHRTEDVLDMYAVFNHDAGNPHAIPPLMPDPDLIRRGLESVDEETSAPSLQVLLAHWHKVAPTKTEKWEAIHAVAMAAIRTGNAPALALVLPGLMERLSVQSRRELVRSSIPCGHLKVFNLIEKVSSKEWRDGLKCVGRDDIHPVTWWLQVAGRAEGSRATASALQKLVTDCGLPPKEPLVLHVLATKWEMLDEEKLAAVDVLIRAGADASLCDSEGRRADQVISKPGNAKPSASVEARFMSAILDAVWASKPASPTSKPRF